MNQSSLTDDLAFVRDLAEAGQQAPLLGGRFLAWWGGLAAIAYAGHYLIASEIFALPSVYYAWLWLSFSIIGILGYFMIIKTMPGDKPGASSVSNRTEAIVWKAAGFALFAYFGSLMVKSLVDGSPAVGFAYSLPVVFAIYGVALFTTGYMAKQAVLKNASIVALLMVVLATWFTGTDFAWAIASIGAFLTVFLPGVILIRNEPASVV